MEEISGIAAVSWRKAYTQGQRPTAEMIESVAKAWPEHAFWLATGIPDALAGHVGVLPAKDWTVDYLDFWADRPLPYTCALFNEVLRAQKLIEKRIDDHGDGGFSTAEKARIFGTEEMRLKELEHQITEQRSRRRNNENPYLKYDDNDLSTNLPNFNKSTN